MYMWYEIITKYNTKKSNASKKSQLSLLQKKCELVHKSYRNQKIEIPHYSWESVGMSALDLYTMSISQTPGSRGLYYEASSTYPGYLLVIQLHLTWQKQSVSQPRVSQSSYERLRASKGGVCSMWPIAIIDKSTVSRAAYFTNEEQIVILDKYEEVKHIIQLEATQLQLPNAGRTSDKKITDCVKCVN